MNKKLATTRRKRLERQIEAAIKSIEKWHLSVGKWLAEIRDKKLYQPEFDSWEQYASQRWGSKQRAFQLIQAAEVVGGLKPENAEKIANERQSRALASIPADNRDAAMELAEMRGDGTLTARGISEAWSELESGKDDPKAICRRITELYALLPKLSNSGASVQNNMVKCCNAIRFIGCLLEIIMGRKHNWTKERFRKFEKQLPFKFDRARECFGIYGSVPEKPSLEDAAKVADKIFQIMGEMKAQPKIRKEAHAANPSVIIFNILKTAEVSAAKRLKGWEAFTDEMKRTTIDAVQNHLAWITETAAGLKSPALPDNVIPAPLAAFMGAQA